jgi:hypothetical protein
VNPSQSSPSLLNPHIHQFDPEMGGCRCGWRPTALQQNPCGCAWLWIPVRRAAWCGNPAHDCEQMEFNFGERNMMTERRASGLLGTDESALKWMLANSGHRYFVRVSNDGSKILVSGRHLGADGQRTSMKFDGTVELVFDDRGDLLTVAGRNDELPPMGFWGRVRFLFGWREATEQTK